MVLDVVRSREGWELYIVTDGVMVSILLDEGAHCKKRVVLWKNNSRQNTTHFLH
jgi:hypothetical protein